MSTHRRKALSRRTFLKGAGATIALPFLEAMLPRTARAQGMTEVPRRMLVYYVPNGIHMPEWTPDEAGASWTAKRILAPLESLRSEFSVITGLENNSGWAHGDGPGDHARGTGTFLTARRIKKTDGTDIRNGVSVDQVAAEALKDKTRFASLQLGMDGGGSTGNCDSGYSCAYARNISWANETTPLPKMTDVGQAFDYIFGGFDPQQSAESIARRRAYRKSILDYVRQDTTALQQKLGATDRAKLDQYLTGLRELERRVEADTNGPACTPPEEGGAPTSYAAKAQAMADLMVAAFQCDLTRVMTFMLSNAGSGRNYQNEPGVNVSGNHHQISHHESKAENFEKLTKIGTWEVQQFAYLLEGLKGAEDVDGNSVLDNSLVYFSSEISDGNRHNHDNLPVILAGGGGGALRRGEHIRVADKTPVANLYLTMLRLMGLDNMSFGADSTGELRDVLTT